MNSPVIITPPMEFENFDPVRIMDAGWKRRVTISKLISAHHPISLPLAPLRLLQPRSGSPVPPRN
jgi:hypothetical protein